MRTGSGMDCSQVHAGSCCWGEADGKEASPFSDAFDADATEAAPSWTHADPSTRACFAPMMPPAGAAPSAAAARSRRLRSLREHHFAWPGCTGTPSMFRQLASFSGPTARQFMLSTKAATESSSSGTG